MIHKVDNDLVILSIIVSCGFFICMMGCMLIPLMGCCDDEAYEMQDVDLL